MQKHQIFKEYLETNDNFIDFNGLHYTLVNTNKEIINITNTADEMLNYIIGFNEAKKQSQQIIEDLEIQNQTNIKNYEKLIRELRQD